MKRIALFLALSITCSYSQGQDASQAVDLQTEAYLSLVTGQDTFEKGEMKEALGHYRLSLVKYQQIQKADPSFMADRVASRVKECQLKIEAIERQLGVGSTVTAIPGGSEGPRLATQPPGPTRMENRANPTPVRRPVPPRQVPDEPEMTNPELLNKTADLEYMEKYIEALREVKSLRERMVSIENREESSNLTILGLNKQVESLAVEREDLLASMSKANELNQNLVTALDSAEKYEQESARLGVALKASEDRYAVLDAKLATVEREFQSGKDSVRENQASMNQMKRELQQETDRANEMAVEIAKLKNDMNTIDPELVQLRKEKRDLDRKMKGQRESSDKKIASLTTRLDETREQLEAAMSDLAGMKKEVSEMPDVAGLNDEIEILNAENESLQALIEDQKASMSESDDASLALAEMESRYAASTNEVATLTAQVVSLEEQIQLVTGDEDLAARLAGLTEDNALLKSKLATLEGAGAAMELELNSRMEAEEIAIASREKALNRMKDLQLNVEALKGSASGAGAKIEELLAENQSLGGMNADLNRQLKEVENASIEGMQAEQARWERDKMLMDKNHTAAMADQAKEISELKAEKVELLANVDASEEAFDMLKVELAESKKASSELMKSAGSASSMTDRLTKKIATLEADQQRMKETMAAQEERAAAAEKETRTAREDRDRIQDLADQLALAVKKSAADHQAQLSGLSSEMEQHKEALKQKEAAMDKLREQKAAEKVVPAKNNGIGTILPVTALQEASGLIPFVELEANAAGEVVVEYPGLGKIVLK